MTLRQLTLEDMDEVARVHRAAFDAALPWLAGRHTPEEDRAFFRERVLPARQLWGSGLPGALDGFIAWRVGWIDHLYVRPDAHGRGVGEALLELAKTHEPRLQLWTFQRNATARRFYERRGFVCVEATDGAGNEEREPDVRYVWPGDGAA